MDETIVIPKFRLKPEDFTVAHTPRGLLVAALFSLLGAFSAVGVCFFAGGIERGMAIATLIVGTPAIFAAILMRGVVAVRKPGNAVHLLEREIALGPGGLTQTVEGGLTTYAPWTMITKVVDGPKHIQLFFSQAQFFAIPRRALTPELEREVLTFLHSKGLLKPRAR